jgi:hypothetical protein
MPLEGQQGPPKRPHPTVKLRRHNPENLNLISQFLSRIFITFMSDLNESVTCDPSGEVAT